MARREQKWQPRLMKCTKCSAETHSAKEGQRHRKCKADPRGSWQPKGVK
ncbi:MAG: hypothetical protein KAS32_19400 [Candidatus Peribacteraceae bacterium]|nr:hypothetical protein [Candidatus Peribacteraceae bacterium]